MNMCDIQFDTEGSWMDGNVLTATFHDGDGISYTARRMDKTGQWAVYFAMDLRNGYVLWSHGVDLLGVQAKVLPPKDQFLMDACADASSYGIEDFEAVMDMAAKRYEGQGDLI
jgi:hypothetical protein